LTFSDSCSLKFIDGFSFGRFTEITIPHSVRGIGSEGFSDCAQLKHVRFSPNSQLRVISGFSACVQLASISLPDSLTTVTKFDFRGCTILAHTTFSSKSQLTHINGFQGCGFDSFTFPAAVFSIGPDAFFDCRRLGVLEFPPDSQVHEIRGFRQIGVGTVRLPCSVEILGATAFTGCSSLSLVIVDENAELSEIGGFYDCGKLATFGPQSSVKGVWNLSECPALRQVMGFDRCAISAVEFPESVEAIAGFNYCCRLESVVFGMNVQSIVGFAGAMVGKVVFPPLLETCRCLGECPKLSNFDLLPVRLRAVGGFEELRRLTAIGIPATVEIVEKRAFENCRGLVSVVFVEDSHLRDINGLSGIGISEIVIPDSVENIRGLSHCPNLETVTFGANSRLAVISGLADCAIERIRIPPGVREIGPTALLSPALRLIVREPDSMLARPPRDGGPVMGRTIAARYFVSAPEGSLAECRRRVGLFLAVGRAKVHKRFMWSGRRQFTTDFPARSQPQGSRSAREDDSGDFAAPPPGHGDWPRTRGDGSDDCPRLPIIYHSPRASEDSSDDSAAPPKE
jgi:hypothetical protein